MSAGWGSVAVAGIVALVLAAAAYTRWTFKLGELVAKLTANDERHTLELEKHAKAIRELQRARFRDRLT